MPGAAGSDQAQGDEKDHYPSAQVRFSSTLYQCKVDVDMLNAVKSVLADVSSIRPDTAKG